MKLPSLNYLIQNAKQSFLRFPFTIISALIAVCIGIYLIEVHDDLSNIFPYINVMLCTGLGIPLFFCINVFAYSKDYTTKKKLLYNIMGIIVLIAIYFTLPGSDSTQNTSLPYIRYGIYNITIHLLVAFVPFIGKRKLNGFWHYNRILFTRFLLSFLYSAFLYAGLALALGSLDFLFDIDLHQELFFEMFIVIAGFFNTWFFIAGIPGNFDALDELNEYPKGIKIFSQFILLPLLVLYLVILYVYASKIVLLWSWPKGIVSYLIACVAVLGILTLLLIHPYGNLPGNTWIKKFSKIYYLILFPLIVLLFFAIGMRVADYGITINRYVILLLGIWLTIVSFYFTSGKTNIKFIPISLATILILMSFGYWGMFSVSERSQVNRLKAILEQSKILQSDKVQHEVIWQKDSLPNLYASGSEETNETLLNDSLHNEVKSILDYLDYHHGFAAIRPWYQQNIDSIVRLTYSKRQSWQKVNEAEAYMRSLGLKCIYKYKNADDQFSYSSINSNNQKVLDIHQYDYLVEFETNEYKRTFNNLDSFYIDDVKYLIQYTLLPKDKLLIITKADTVIFSMDTVVEKLLSKYERIYNSDIPTSEMLLYSSNNHLDIKMELHHLFFKISNDSLRLSSINGNLFIRIKDK